MNHFVKPRVRGTSAKPKALSVHTRHRGALRPMLNIGLIALVIRKPWRVLINGVPLPTEGFGLAAPLASPTPA